MKNFCTNQTCANFVHVRLFGAIKFGLRRGFRTLNVVRTYSAHAMQVFYLSNFPPFVCVVLMPHVHRTYRSHVCSLFIQQKLSHAMHMHASTDTHTETESFFL